MRFICIICLVASFCIPLVHGNVSWATFDAFEKVMTKLPSMDTISKSLMNNKLLSLQIFHVGFDVYKYIMGQTVIAQPTNPSVCRRLEAQLQLATQELESEYYTTKKKDLVDLMAGLAHLLLNCEKPKSKGWW